MKKGWFVLAALFGLVGTVGVVCQRLHELPRIRSKEGHLVTVIGGMDGPTAVFVAGHSRSSLWRTVWVHGCRVLSKIAQFRVCQFRRMRR